MDREQAMEEIHGVRRIVSDEPIDDQRKNEVLLQMQHEIDMIQDKPAYEEALRMNSQYVIDEKFRLKFLYAERFNPQRAAVRMMKYLENVSSKDMFGPNALLRPLRYTDLTPVATAILRKGTNVDSATG